MESRYARQLRLKKEAAAKRRLYLALFILAFSVLIIVGFVVATNLLDYEPSTQQSNSGEVWSTQQWEEYYATLAPSQTAIFNQKSAEAARAATREAQETATSQYYATAQIWATATADAYQSPTPYPPVCIDWRVEVENYQYIALVLRGNLYNTSVMYYFSPVRWVVTDTYFHGGAGTSGWEQELKDLPENFAGYIVAGEFVFETPDGVSFTHNCNQ